MKLGNIINELGAEFSGNITARRPQEVKIMYRKGDNPEDVIPLDQAPDKLKADAEEIRKELLKQNKFKFFAADKVPIIDMRGQLDGSYKLTSDDERMIFKATKGKDGRWTIK